jgi:hypothetical protein
VLTRLIALLILSGALGVFGQGLPTPVTYTFGLEHVTVHGRITGVADGDTINVLIHAEKQIRVRQQIKVRIALLMRRRKGQAFGQRAKQAMSKLVFDEEVELRPHTIDRYARLVPEYLLPARTSALSCSRLVFAGCTKDISFRRHWRLRLVTGQLKPWQNPISSASGRTLTRCHPGNGAKTNVRACKGQVRFDSD